MKYRVAVAVAVVLATTPALADKSDKADPLFQRGKKLLAAKQYADACASFEQSDKLESGIGTKLNVAKCYEDWGRLATAYHWYADAAKMAAVAKDHRAPKIKALMTELDGDVPRLIIKVPEGADPTILATITLDDRPLSRNELDTALRVDPGPHAIVFRVSGKPHQKMAPVERGGESEISLDIPQGDSTSKQVASDKSGPARNLGEPNTRAVQPSYSGHGRRVAGITVASAGGVAVAVAGILTLGARGTYKDALAAHCMGSTTMCNEEGLSATQHARHTANIATVVTLIGTAAVIAGVVLYVTTPARSGKNGRRTRELASEADALYLSPVLATGGGGIALGGAF